MDTKRLSSLELDGSSLAIWRVWRLRVFQPRPLVQSQSLPALLVAEPNKEETDQRERYAPSGDFIQALNF
jgi:hypothetical protein